MNEDLKTLIIITITVVYILCGIGTTMLDREINKDTPRFFGIFWPLILIIAAFCGAKKDI